MVRVKKLEGEFPEEVVVLDRTVLFDAEGASEVEDQEVLDVLAEIPGYEIEGQEDASEDDGEEDGEDENDAPAAPAKPARKPAPRAKPVPKQS